MSLQILPVFVSSTSIDLQPERAAVKDAVLRLRKTQFVGMEYFGSRDETPREASLIEIDHSRAYVGIIAARYGSGITEAEYRRARARGLPCFIYFKDDATVPDKLRETDPAQVPKLDALKRELRDTHTVKEFSSPDKLAIEVTADLHRWLFDEYVTPKLQGALRGEVSRDEAQALLDAVKDLSALNRNLVAQLRSNNFNVASPIIPTLHQLRAPVGDFVGREKEIESLLATLRGGTSAGISGISGMGGIGKTELAIYVANRLRDAYPDAQLVVDMRGTDNPPRDPSDALAACIRAFVGLEQRLPDDAEVLAQLYRSVLEGKRALILLDNASDGAQARPLLPPAGSALLVTSRNVVTLPRMTRVTLDQLHPTEARELLTGIASRIAPAVADRICYLCGYLPLAIRAAGSLLDVTVDLDSVDYAAQLNDERTRLELVGTEGVDISVEASFNLSYARLDTEAASVFRGLAVFPTTFDAKAEAAVCEDEKHKHLTGLVRRSLVLYNEETRRYRLHDLARLFADSRLSETERSAGQMRHAAHYLSVLGECQGFYLQGGEAIKTGLTLFDAELRNIEAGQKWAHEQSGVDETAAQLCSEYPKAGAYVLNLRQYPRERILWLEAALSAAQQLNDSGVEGVHLGNLGVAFYHLGEYRRAIEFYERRLVIVREIGDRRGEGNTLGNLGLAYADLGETRRAVEFYEQSLAIAREIGDRRGEGGVLGFMGVAYKNLGETRRAIEFHEQYLTIAREIGDRRGAGNALGNLGLAYANLGETRRAVEFYEQHLAIAREIGDRYGEGNALGNMGVAYKNMGETRRAIEFYEQRLIIAREIGDRRGEGSGFFNTALALDELGDRAKARAHAEVALEIYEQIESPSAKEVSDLLAKWRGEA